MSATQRRTAARGGIPAESVLLWAAIGVVVLVVGGVAAVLQLADRLTGRRQALPGNPFRLFAGLLDGTVRWTPAATGCAAALGGLLLAAAGGGLYATARFRRSRSRVDRAARHLGRGGDLGELTGQPAAARAARLTGAAGGDPGLAVARTVTGRRLLWQGWEDVSVDVWGPRTGKTTSRAIPAVLAAPGAVVATSNKRDLVDATRGLRADAGEVWVFDPQNLAGEPAGWWWDPLSYVVDEVKAASLAEVFTAAAREPGSRVDAYFDPRGQQLLADLLLAAALAGRQLTQVYLWLTRPADDEPADILRQQGFPLSAASVEEAVNMADKQRGGVYGTAQKTCGFMTNRQAMRWATPGGGTAGGVGERRRFDPAGFVAGAGTLYSLSKEGSGTAGPLVTALTVAVCEAAEDLAKRSPGGRLPVPMVAVLDEAANVCRWSELPNLYSHYGSRGIVLMTILQSWSQGVEVWGRDGMRKLWSAATVKVYGGGVGEREFLAELSELIGDYELPQTSTSHSRGGRTVSTSSRRERILDVADLGAMPRGRVIVFGSGARPTLAATLPWMDGPHAPAVRASLAAADPAASAGRPGTDTAAPGAADQPPARTLAAPNPWLSGS